MRSIWTQVDVGGRAVRVGVVIEVEGSVDDYIVAEVAKQLAADREVVLHLVHYEEKECDGVPLDMVPLPGDVAEQIVVLDRSGGDVLAMGFAVHRAQNTIDVLLLHRDSKVITMRFR